MLFLSGSDAGNAAARENGAGADANGAKFADVDREEVPESALGAAD